MTNFTDSAQSKQIDQREHNNDASSKRVVLRYQNLSNGEWYNYIPGKVAGIDYDYIDCQQTSATVETYVFKSGGSGGTTVQTIVVSYTDSTKANIDTVEYS